MEVSARGMEVSARGVEVSVRGMDRGAAARFQYPKRKRVFSGPVSVLCGLCPGIRRVFGLRV